MSTSLAIVEDNNQFVSPISEMDSESLGVFVRDGMIGVATKLVELKPCVEELWRRIDRGEVILGCATKKEFCQQVLQRTPRAVRYMLAGGNPDNDKRGEIISPSKSHVTDAEFVEYESDHPEIRKSAANLIGRGLAPTDVVGALVGMNYSKPMAEAAVRIVAEAQPSPAQASPERTLEDVLEKLVHRIALQPYGYYAAKFALYPEQHTTELDQIDLLKQEIWKRIVEIGQQRLAVRASLENIES